MGLPSGNRWAVSNLDATGPYFLQESPYQYACSFFSWGNVTPHNPISDTEFDYDFGGFNQSSPYFEGQPYGDTPGSLLTGNIPISNDAARRMLGKPWRIPTNDDFGELFENVIFIDENGIEVETTKADKRVIVNGVLGIYLRSKINGERVFFSCSGYGADTLLQYSRSAGFYWTTIYYTALNARSMGIQSSRIIPQHNSVRARGFAIRPVWNPRDLHG